MHTMNTESCPFCNAIDSLSRFASSEDFVALYNIAPILPGHSLVVPKRHVKSILDLDNDEVAEMMRFARNVVVLLISTFKGGGFNLTIQEGEEAGQTIAHLHMHLIPRRAGDLKTPGDWFPLLKGDATQQIDSNSRPRLTETEMKKIVMDLRTKARAAGLA